MADSVIDSEKFILFDNWPGVARYGLEPPGGFTGYSHFNVDSPAYPLGDKICVWNNSDVAGDDGYATFIYLCFLPITEAMPAVLPKQLAVAVLAGSPYNVSTDMNQNLQDESAMAAYALAPMTPIFATQAKYGYFWCGGICPEAFVPALGGNYDTDDNVDIGPITGQASTDGDTIVIANCAATVEGIIGYSYSLDD